MLASVLFPYDEDAVGLVDGWLAELEHEGCVVRYRVDGDLYLQVCNWLKHQKIDRPSASKFPAFDEGSRVFDEASRKIVQDQGTGNREQGTGKEKLLSQPPVCDAPALVLEPEHPSKGKELDAALGRVWSHYLEKTGRNEKLYSLTAARRAKGLARLRECLKRTGGDLDKSVELMNCAVDAMAASDWSMGRDPKTSGKRYCDWSDHLFSSADRLEKWWSA